jgi:hypothetical protein
MASTSGSTTSAMLRLMSDLRSIKQEPPEVRSAARRVARSSRVC